MTTANILTIVKDYVWIVAPIGLLIGLLNAYFGGGWGRRGVSRTFALTRTRKLASLQQRRAWLQELHDSDRAYYGWLLAGVLWVLALCAGQLAFEGFMAGNYRFKPPQLQLAASITLDLVRYNMGLVVYGIAMARLLNYRQLQHFDRTITALDRAIAKIEAKTPLQPVPSAG